MFDCKKKIWLFLFNAMLCFPMPSFSKLYFAQDVITKEIKNDLNAFTFDFELKKDSQNIVKILMTKSSCSCMDIGLPTEEIAPKASLKLSENISTSKLSESLQHHLMRQRNLGMLCAFNYATKLIF